MRARPARCHVLILGGLLTAFPALADDPPITPKKAAARPPIAVKPPVTQAPRAVEKAAVEEKPEVPANLPPLPPKPYAITPATPADVARERLTTEVRLRELATDEFKNKPSTKPIVDLLRERLRLLGEWEKVFKGRGEAEKPVPSPEQEAADQKADLEKTHALLEQAGRSPDSVLPEVFQAPAQPKSTGAGAPPPEARLGEMKDAIEAARNELKDRTAELGSLRSDGARTLTEQVATLRTKRDKVHQEFVALMARRAEREAAINSAQSPDARDLARERLSSFEWEARIEAERLAAIEAEITLAGKKLDLGTSQIQAKAAREQLAKKVLERMENRYSAMAERQRSDLKRAVAKEETRAASTDDPLVRRRAKRTAELFELESQVVAYEKAYATSGGVSLTEQTALADATESGFATLQKMLDDNEVSPLDALRLKNDFRRIGPERAQIVRTDLAASEAEEIAYENALTDAEIDLVNDSRDDRYDRESLLEQVPEARRAEASAMLEELETRHRALLNRRKNVLQKLASRAEETHKQVARRIAILDKEYTFIRAHIFWIRDAEPLGVATVAHARDEAIRTARALVRLAIEPTDRSLWGHASIEFILAILAVATLPWPLWLGQRALDRYRLGNVPETALGLADFPTQGVKASQTMGNG
jgi:hypothetical protein